MCEIPERLENDSFDRKVEACQRVCKECRSSNELPASYLMPSGFVSIIVLLSSSVGRVLDRSERAMENLGALLEEKTK